MIKFLSLGHISIVVDNIDQASDFYQDLFGAIPMQDFPHFKNIGFAKAAGFIENAQEVDVTIRFLKIPTPEGIFIELMEYHYPISKEVANNKQTTDRNLVGHIAIRVSNIMESFEHIKSVAGVKFISDSKDYRPAKIDEISPSMFYFFDKTLENNPREKTKVCQIIGNTRYFYFVDKYGVQWELEQGHGDVGSTS